MEFFLEKTPMSGIDSILLNFLGTHIPESTTFKKTGTFLLIRKKAQIKRSVLLRDSITDLKFKSQCH